MTAHACAQEWRQKGHDTFELVKKSVEDEINAQATQSSGNQQHQHGRTEAVVKASNKQIKYILDLGKSRGKALPDLNAEAKRLCGVDSIYELNKKSASRLVDILKMAA